HGRSGWARSCSSPTGRFPRRRPCSRWLRSPSPGGSSGGSWTAERASGVFGDRAEPTFALLEVADRFEQELAVEVGPEDRCEPQLGVRSLPEQEVRDPHLAARSDE